MGFSEYVSLAKNGVAPSVVSHFSSINSSITKHLLQLQTSALLKNPDLLSAKLMYDFHTYLSPSMSKYCTCGARINTTTGSFAQFIHDLST